jgi:hypothetical protein
MATSSILGADRAPSLPSGTDVESLGPSDSTDSGSDSVGAFGDDELASDTDAAGTGERAAIEPMLDADSRDILPDHVEAVPRSRSRHGESSDAGVETISAGEAGLEDLAALAGEDDQPDADVDDPDAPLSP